jgi:hypothetical protein
VHPMERYHGYGVSRYGPVLQSIRQFKWLQVVEDAKYVYVRMMKAENFYQLPVIVKQTRPVTSGIEFLVDVYSEGTQKRLVYPNLTVVTATGTAISKTLKVGQKTSLLGFFSVNLRKAMAAATGHDGGPSGAVFAPQTWSFLPSASLWVNPFRSRVHVKIWRKRTTIEV